MCKRSSRQASVCTMMGTDEYVPLAARYEIPIVVTGFEPLDLLQGISSDGECIGGAT
ncbi:MAG: hypothetical protein QM784_04215 [Polyangiaceae bacterium]